VPVEVGAGGKFTFGEPQEVAIVYKDVKSAAAALPYRWQDRKAALSAQGVAEPQAMQDSEIHVHISGDADAERVTDLIAGAMKPMPKVERQLPPAEAIKRVASATATQTPDATPAAGSTPTSEEVSGVPVADPTKLREALGLAADASDDDVRAAYAAAFATPPAPPEADQSDPTSALLSAIPQDGNAILLDRENYKALVEMAKRGDIAHEAMKRGERDTFLKEACKAGRFQPSRLDHYKEMWDRNPDETRAFVNLMPPNSVPVTAAGSYGVDVDMNEADLAYAAMYPGEAR
jgi:hypothetical protein